MHTKRDIVFDECSHYTEEPNVNLDEETHDQDGVGIMSLMWEEPTIWLRKFQQSKTRKSRSKDQMSNRLFDSITVAE